MRNADRSLEDFRSLLEELATVRERRDLWRTRFEERPDVRYALVDEIGRLRSVIRQQVNCIAWELLERNETEARLLANIAALEAMIVTEDMT